MIATALSVGSLRDLETPMPFNFEPNATYDYLLALLKDWSLVILGSIFGAYFKYIKLNVTNFIKNRRLRLSGEFLSFFDDEEDGKRIVHRSTSKVIQKGDRIEITTTNKAGRRWTMSGRVHDRAYLLGDYAAQDIHDEGIGTFFLQIKNRNLYEGFWHGYDHANQTLTGGKYWFVRKLDFEISPAEATDVSSIIGISADEFGAGYIENIAEMIASNDHHVLVAHYGREVYGFVTAYLLKPNEMQAFLDGANYDPLLKHYDENGLIGVIKSIAVRKSYQHKSIGFTLFRTAETKLINDGAKCLLVPGWEYNGTARIAGILNVSDYEVMSRRDKIWQQACDRGEFRCPARTETCNCNCVFYKKMVYQTVSRSLKRLKLTI